MTPRQHNIVGIQYLRAIAAIAVVLDHSSAMAAFPKYFGHEALGGALEKGAIGVDIFFMISGFIISIIALDRSTLDPVITVSEFFRRRFIRIVPLMWLAITSYALMRWVSIHEFPLVAYLNALFLLPVGDIQPNNIWTLRNEAIFYVVFAFTFLSKMSFRALVIAWIAAPILLWAFGLGSASNEAHWLSQLIWNFGSPANIEFGMGLLLGVIWLLWSHKIVITIPALLSGCVIYFALAWICVAHFDINMGGFVDTLLLSALFTPLLLMAIHCRPNSPSPLGLLLGSASFSIYLFHPHLLSAMLTVWRKLSPETPVEVVIVSIAIAAISLCVAIHFLVELPLLKFAGNAARSRTFKLKNQTP